jgi:hypothetical protein
MDHLQTRLDALEQQMHTVNHRLRWWRGLACGLLGLAVLTWALPAGTAPEEASQGGQRGLAQRVAALENLLKHFSRKGNEVFITGANLHIVNGLGLTGCTNEEGGEIPDCPNPNGLGNLIVGYNEPRLGENVRTGSHNVVVGQRHNFSRFGGLVVGDLNEISGDFAAVSGGRLSRASGNFSSVSGGEENTASGIKALVSGGWRNTASGFWASVSGGAENAASGEEFASVSGGQRNTASGFSGASVSGGFENTASSFSSSISGGQANTASNAGDSVSGGFGNTASGGLSSVTGGNGNMASGDRSVVSGGEFNTASGFAATVSGGRNRMAAGNFDWVAGSLFEDE